MLKKVLNNRFRIVSIALAALLILTCLSLFPAAKTYAANGKKKLVGIDVSDHNGKINWKKAKAGGIDFAIIRIGWGDNLYSQDDSRAVYNMQQCEKYDIPYGVYIYSYALTKKAVDKEVAHMIRMANGHTPALGYWFDMEDADFYKERHKLNPYKNGKKLTSFCLRFLELMQEKGYDNIGVYANPDYFINVLDYDKIKEEGMIWLAHWGVKSPGFDCEMWQYSATGKVAGNTGYFDMNLIYPDSYLYAYATGGASGNFQRVSGLALQIGDLNGDGVVNALDVRLLKKQMFMGGSLNESFIAGDINEDGTVNLIDLALLKKSMAQMETEEEETEPVEENNAALPAEAPEALPDALPEENTEETESVPEEGETADAESTEEETS